MVGRGFRKCFSPGGRSYTRTVSEAIVLLDGASVRFGPIPVLDGVDLTVEPGQTVGIAGPNGSGKTTLLGVIATLVPLTGGTGRVFGAPLGSAAAVGVRGRIGLSGHDPALYEHLTLAENLALVARLAGLPQTEVERALDIVGLTAAGARRTDRCSHGMRRRVDLATIVMTDPDLVLLDEAHAGLDAAADAIIAALIRRATGRGGAAVIVSHDVDRLADETDLVLTLDPGAG